MTIDTINLGNYANDGTGDDLRTAFTKVNSAFETLNSFVTNNTGSVTSGSAGRLAYYPSNGPTVAATSNTMSWNNALGLLTVNQINANNIESTVYGIDVRSLLAWDFGNFGGNFDNPIQYLLTVQDIDFGPFIPTSFDQDINLDQGIF
jgi:hypothetical protein